MVNVFCTMYDMRRYFLTRLDSSFVLNHFYIKNFLMHVCIVFGSMLKLVHAEIVSLSIKTIENFSPFLKV